MTVFFVLSGFLISRLLLEEHERQGTIDLRRFWLRRGARLMPALVVYLATVTIVLFLTGAPLLPVVVSATYTSNFALASGQPLSVLAHTWSLSMEEQFYLVWPLLILLVLRRKRSLLTLGLLVMLFCTSLWRWWLISQGSDYGRVAFAPDTRMDAILLGCLIAVAAPALLRWRRTAEVAALIGLACLVWGCRTGWLEYSPHLAVVTLGAGAVVWWAASAHSGWILRGFSAWPLTHIGMVSYGVYLWHDPIARMSGRMLPIAAALPLALFVALVLAALSWRCVEQPLRNWMMDTYDRPKEFRVPKGRRRYSSQLLFVACSRLGWSDRTESSEVKSTGVVYEGVIPRRGSRR